MDKILVVIDMQRDFVTGTLGSRAAAGVVDKIKALLETCKNDGYPFLFTMDTHQEADYTGENMSVEAKSIPAHCIKGSEGWKIVPQLEHFSRGNTAEKPAFLSQTLAGEISSRCSGDPCEITLCGVCTDICVISNALMLRAAFPRTKIRVQADCCAGTSSENHDAALAVMKSCLVEII